MKRIFRRLFSFTSVAAGLSVFVALEILEAANCLSSSAMCSTFGVNPTTSAAIPGRPDFAENEGILKVPFVNFPYNLHRA